MTDVQVHHVFPAAYGVKVLQSTSDARYVFERPGTGHNGEVAVEVTTNVGRSWVGVAHLGELSVRAAVTGVFSTPDASGLLLLGRGDAFLVDVDAPDRFQVVDTGGPVVATRAIIDQGLLLLASPWTVTALEQGGIRWRTGRLAIDGLRLDEIEENRVAGVADPDSDEPRDFVVNLDNGSHDGGVPFA